MAIAYHIYANTGAGDPINYSSPITTVSTLTWTSASLTYPGNWSFAVRAFDTVSGLEEQNLDCSTFVSLDSSSDDITNQPSPPFGVRAMPVAGGTVRVEWPYPVVNRANVPTGFHVYIGIGGMPNYATPAQTVLFNTGIANTFSASIVGLTDGITYTIGVRAFNAAAEETNTNGISVTADATGPSIVDSLIGIANS